MGAGSEVEENILLGHPFGDEVFRHRLHHALLPAEHRGYAAPVLNAILLRSGGGAAAGGGSLPANSAC